MPYFRYQALDADQQVVAGELESASVAAAVAHLEAQGLVVQSIGFASADAEAAVPEVRGSVAPVAREELRPAGADRAVLEALLRLVMERTRPQVAALYAYAAELPRGARRQLEAVLRMIELGDCQQAAVAVEQRPTFWMPLLSAAAASSQSDEMLKKFVKESQQALELSRQWWWTLAYPGFLVIFAGGMLIFLSLVPIPIFRDIFQGFGLRLPWLTRFVIELARWIETGTLLGVLAAVAVVVFVLWQSRKLLPESVRRWWAERWPAPLRRATALARFSQFLGDLLAADIETPAALRIAGLTSKNRLLGNAARRLAADFESHRAIDTAAYRRTVSVAVLHALQADLPAASRAGVLQALSRCHAKRAAVALSWTRGIVEPLLILVVGLLVGIAVIALFLPLISLIQGLS